MIRTFILIFLTHLSIATIFGQERIWITQSKISDVIAFEKKVDPDVTFLSQNESLSKDYYPLADKHQVVNPVIAQRKPISYLPVYAEYFYTPDDSLLRLVSYNWEKDRYGNFFDQQTVWKAERKKLDAYDKEYLRIRSMLFSSLGQPISTDSLPKEVSSDEGKYYTSETVWDSADIHADLNMIFAPATYRVRLTLYWKN